MLAQVTTQARSIIDGGETMRSAMSVLRYEDVSDESTIVAGSEDSLDNCMHKRPSSFLIEKR